MRDDPSEGAIQGALCLPLHMKVCDGQQEPAQKHAQRHAHSNHQEQSCNHGNRTWFWYTLVTTIVWCTVTAKRRKQQQQTGYIILSFVIVLS